MNRFTHYIFLAILLLTTGCKQSQIQEGTRLIGQLNQINDTLFFYGSDRFYDQKDTIICTQGVFNHLIEVDTTIIGHIYSNKFEETYLFIGPDDKLTIRVHPADSSKLLITGNTMHQSFNTLQDQLDTIHSDLKENHIVSYIKENPFSLTSIAALQEYLVDQTNPNYILIDSLTKEMPGIIKDRQTIEAISEQLSRAQRAKKNRSALFFNLSDLNGKKVDKSDFKDQLMLLYFWASWDQQSRELNQQLIDIHNTWAKHRKDFSIVGISIDSDSVSLQNAVKQDSIHWTILHDKNGWDSSTADRYGIMKLPTVFLVDKHNTIIERDLPIDSLKNRIITNLNNTKHN